jgi:hypothetical protein
MRHTRPYIMAIGIIGAMLLCWRPTVAPGDDLSDQQMASIVGGECMCCFDIVNSTACAYTPCATIVEGQCPPDLTVFCGVGISDYCKQSNREWHECNRETVAYTTQCVRDGTSTTAGCPQGQAKCKLMWNPDATEKTCYYDRCAVGTSFCDPFGGGK